MTALVDNPDWNPSSSQASHHAEGPIVGTHHQGAAGAGGDRRIVRRAFDHAGGCRGHDSYEPPFELIFPRIPRVTAREANSAPATNRMSGPKLQAAGAPTKCRPGTEDWNPESSCG